MTTASVVVNIIDKQGVTYVPGTRLSSYDFSANSYHEANVRVKTGHKRGNVWVPDTFTWHMNHDLEMNIELANAVSSKTFEHEFEHVLGLFDFYDYSGHNPVPGMFFPGMTPDGVHTFQTSVMYDQTPGSYYHSEFDYEMILYAWQENHLQNYYPTVLGGNTQASYHLKFLCMCKL